MLVHHFRALVQEKPAHILYMHKHIQHTDTHLSCHTHLTYSQTQTLPWGPETVIERFSICREWVLLGLCYECYTTQRERDLGTLAQYIRGVNNLQSVTHARRRRLGERACIIVKVLTVKISPHCSSGMQIVREVRKCKCKWLIKFMYVKKHQINFFSSELKQ